MGEGGEDVGKRQGKRAGRGDGRKGSRAPLRLKAEPEVSRSAAGRLRRGFPGRTGSREGPFQLLIGDEHHHIPGAQAEKGGHEPFVEGSGPLLLEHGEGAVASAAVLAQGRVHVSRLDHVDGGGDDGGAKAGSKGGREVAREVICHDVGLQEGFLDEVIGDQLGTVDNGIPSHVGRRAFPEPTEPSSRAMVLYASTVLWYPRPPPARA